MAVLEFARNVCSIKDAQTRESKKRSKNYIIDIMESQKKVGSKGGTMRLGQYPCELKKSSLAHSAYKKAKISGNP